MTTKNPRYVAVLLTILCLQQLNIRSGNAAEVMFRKSDYTVFESNLPVQFELLLQPDPMPSGDITVQIVTVDNTATGGLDFNASSVNVTFPAEDTSYQAFFDIAIYNDKLVEKNEMFSLAISESSLPEGVRLGWPQEVNITITEGNETLSVLATIFEDGIRNKQELLPSNGIYLWPDRPIQKIVFECISIEGGSQISLSSLNQSSVASQIEFSEFPTSLNGFLVCRSNTTEEEQRVYIANATVAGGIAVLITSSPLTVIEGESSVITYLIALVNNSLNVTSSIEVQYFFDGNLPVIVNDRGNGHYDVIFPPVPYGFSVDILFNERVISNQQIRLDVQPLQIADVILQPERQEIFEGQNAYFNCLLNGTDGRLIPVQWFIFIVDTPRIDITMNTTEYLILPPANSTLVIVRPSDILSGAFVECRNDINETRYSAELNILTRDCSVDNGNCEETCTALQNGASCGCPANQTLIETTCVSQSTYFEIYGEVYEDSDIFIHHPLYHLGPFEIICRSRNLNAITEQGQWIVQAFDNSTTVTFNGGTVRLNNSNITASAILRGEGPPRQAVITMDQPIEGYFTCIVNNISYTIRTLTGGKPLLELLTPEPIYVSSSFFTVSVRAVVVNSFGKTVRPSGSSRFAVTLVDDTTNSDNLIQSYDPESSIIFSRFPRNFDLQTEFGINKRLVEISLTSEANFTTIIVVSPVFADVINITSTTGRDIFTVGEFSLTCFTIPSDLPVIWNFIRDFGPDGFIPLAEDPRAVIQSTEYGSKLTLRNTIVEDGGEYECVANFSAGSAYFMATVIPDTVSLAIEYTFEAAIRERPPEMDYPVDGSLYVIQETIESELIALQLLCYNLENDSVNDTELTVTVTNPNHDLSKNPNIVTLDIQQFPPSLNGNITCRSKATGKESTVFIANATLSGIYVVPITESPIYVKKGSTVNFTYRIGLANNSLDVVTNVRIVTVADDIERDSPKFINRGNNFYDVQIPSLCCNLQFFLEFAEQQVSPVVSILAQDFLITPKPGLFAAGREGEHIEISCVPEINTEIQWRRESMPISADGLKYKFSPPNMGHTLTINNLTTSDSGLYTCFANGTTVSIEVFVINEPLAYISNGIQLPTKAVYNTRPPAPIQLICIGTNGNLELQIETDHEDLPSPLNPGLHYTTNDMEILVTAFGNGIFIDINMEGLLDHIEFSCVSLQSKAIATFLITTEQFAVIPTESEVQVAYLSPLILQYIVAVNSNGSHSQLENLTNYYIQYNQVFSENVVVYNSSSIEMISSNVFQLTIPQANQSHTGDFTFKAELMFGEIELQSSTTVMVIGPDTTINGSYPYILVGETVELSCYISFSELVTIPDIINYTVNWLFHSIQERPTIVFQSSAVGSLKHTFKIENISLSASGAYFCRVDSFRPSNLYAVSVFSDPVNIGYSPIHIILDGNVINFNSDPVEPRFSRGLGPSEPFYTSRLNCYTTRGHENPFWEIPSDGSVIPVVSVISPYQSTLYFNGSLPKNYLGTFVCSSTNGIGINSSVIITGNEVYIQPLIPNPFMVKYFQPLTLSFQAAVQSDGIINNVRTIVLEQPGSSESSLITSSDNSAQVFAEDLGYAGSGTTGNYTASILDEEFFESVTVQVIVEIPVLTTNQSSIYVLTGENVTISCTPSDNSLELEWSIYTRNGIEMIPPEPDDEVGSADNENRDGSLDDEDETLNVVSDLKMQLQYQSPYHQLTLINVTTTNSGFFVCAITSPPNDPVQVGGSHSIRLNVLPSVISIGYSPESLIPENNAINLLAIFGGERLRRGGSPRLIRCFTTRGHENPAWIVSNNNFTTGPLMDNGPITLELGDSNVTILINRVSAYLSEIYFNVNNVQFTGSLTCQLQNNPIVQYTVIVTTDDIYFQSLSPNPLMARYFQPVNLTFLLAIRSDGIVNDFESVSAVFQYDTDGNPLGLHKVTAHGTSSQVFMLDLGYAGLHTSGSYQIIAPPPYDYYNRTIEVIVERPTLTASNLTIGVISGETVTFECIPSDPDLELYWTYETIDNFGSVTVDNISESKFLAESSLLHQLILPNATVNDTGTYRCVIQMPPGDSVIISETILLTVIPEVISIGYSPSLVIPANNAINLMEESIRISCFTTRGYENPAWMISRNNETFPIMNTGNITIGGTDVTIIEMNKTSIYQLDILMSIDFETVDDFTSNLTCQSQNSPGVQTRVILTTSETYFQPLSPSPLVVKYFQPVNLMFLLATRSNGISNRPSPLPVFQYDASGNPVRQLHSAVTLGSSSQVFTLDLGHAGQHTPENYIIFENNVNVGSMLVVLSEVPSLTTAELNIEYLNGEIVTIECTPSDPDLELYWTYQTSDGNGTVTIDTISETKFLTESSLFHQLIIPIATIRDTGSYSCVIQRPPGDNIIISKTISLNVLPACGSLDRLSHGILWPITEIGKVVEQFCSDVNPSFGFGPRATRRCREDATWCTVDTSQCSIRPMQQSTIVVYSTYAVDDNIMASAEIEQLNELFDNSSVIFTDLRILSDRLYVELNKKRQVTSMRYSLLAPVIYTVNIINRTMSVDNITEMIRDVEVSTNREEIIGFNAVDVCECVSSSEDLQQSSMVDICIGTSVSPCICDNSSCKCNEEGYAGNGSLCARDSDHDTFPDVELACSLDTCAEDKCPYIATADGQDESSCQPLPNNTAGCSQEVDPYYGINWPSTLINMEATNNCPDGAGTAVRFCDSNGEWGIPVVSNCSSYEYRALLELMTEVDSSEDLNDLTSSLAVVSNKTDEDTSSYPSDLMNTNLLLEFSLDYIEDNPDSLDNETVQNIVDCLSNILSPVNNAGWMELEAENPGQSQMILINSERFGLLLAENLDVGSVQVVVSDNIVISAELVAADNISNITFPEPNSGYNLNNSIFIPANYIQERAMTTGANRIPISNIIYENIQNILPVVSNQPVSPVLSSQVTATSNTSSKFAVELTSQYSINSNDSEELVCGFWNFSLNEGSGGWDTAGVSVVSIDMSSSTIICNSTHLTSFAVLVDVSGGHQDIPEEERTALSIVSYIGCGISIICLVIAIILLVCFRKTIFKGIHNFIHLNLAIALLLALIVFVSGIETATESEVGCTVVAALLHYFFTAVFTWMLCEGIMLYFLLVKVFNTGLGQRKLFYLAIGWGVPVPIVAISAGIAHDQYGNDDFCWIDTEKGAIWGFVAPMLAIIIVNIVFLIMALHSLYKSKRSKVTAEESSRASLVKTILKATVILLPLLGITWVFGILAVNQESSVFAWIFTIFNSLQGMFILFFHVIRNEKIWKRIAFWKDNKYSFIPSSQRSSTASRGAKIKKSIQTASTDPSGYNTELKSKPDISHFEESSGIDTESKVEPSAVETENEKPPITDEKIRQEEEAVTTTTFSVEVKVPSNDETHM